jgi:hypothetical protein
MLMLARVNTWSEFIAGPYFPGAAFVIGPMDACANFPC